MQKARLTRRAFLRLSSLTASGIIAAACEMRAPPAARPLPQSTTETGGTATPAGAVQATSAPPVAEASATATPSSAVATTATAGTVQLQLDRSSGDLWSWKHQVTGTIEGNCPEAYLTVGKRKVDITRDGEHFSADVTLDEGANDVAVVCRQPGGHEDRSDVSTYTVPLKRRPTATIKIAIENNAI